MNIIYNINDTTDRLDNEIRKVLGIEYPFKTGRFEDVKKLVVTENVKLLKHIHSQDKYTNRDSYIMKLISELVAETQSEQENK